MIKTVGLALNRFPAVPLGLRSPGNPGVPLDRIDVDLARLYHHYYLDSYGHVPPDPDPAQFEYLRFLAAGTEFRLQGDGIGVCPSKRRHSSNELGQAFCRWFLHEHQGLVYFAHIDEVIARRDPIAGSLLVRRTCSGDVPDYLCSDLHGNVFVGEAKGRYDSVSFASTAFQAWRNQFGRIEAVAPSGSTVQLKGYIVATRFGTEKRPRASTRVYAEDPYTPGEFGADDERTAAATRALGAAVTAVHYGNVARKLGQPVLGAALTEGYTVPDQVRFPATVWAAPGVPALAGYRFVGGYYPSGRGVQFARTQAGLFQALSGDPLRIDQGTATFFGVEEGVYANMAEMARTGAGAFAGTNPFENLEPFYSLISHLRDGSIIAPLEFFVPLGAGEDY